MSPKPTKPPKFEVVAKKSDHEEVAKWFSENAGGDKDFMVIIGDPKSKSFTVRSNIGVGKGVPLLLNMLNDMFEFVQHESGRVIADLNKQVRRGLK